MSAEKLLYGIVALYGCAHLLFAAISPHLMWRAVYGSIALAAFAVLAIQRRRDVQRSMPGRQQRRVRDRR